MRTTQLTLPADENGITQAAVLLKQGKLVALPTETVYGLGADACNDNAVAAIFEAKGRPSFNPLIVHIPDAAMAREYAEWNDNASALASAFWPGPLTLVLPLRPDSSLSKLVTAGQPSVALRVPKHSAAQRLLRAVDGPIAAPSANPSGRISPTTAAHVAAGLGKRVAAILDDGPCPVGLESTIIGLTTNEPILLRAGGVSQDRIEAALGHAIEIADGSQIVAPGQLASHYAPEGTVRLNATKPYPNEVMLGFGAIDGTLNLSPAGDLTQAAANLFNYLHQLDAIKKPIAVAPIPDHGLGQAINDRLRRAAAPR